MVATGTERRQRRRFGPPRTKIVFIVAELRTANHVGDKANGLLIDIWLGKSRGRHHKRNDHRDHNGYRFNCRRESCLRFLSCLVHDCSVLPRANGLLPRYNADLENDELVLKIIIR